MLQPTFGVGDGHSIVDVVVIVELVSITDWASRGGIVDVVVVVELVSITDWTDGNGCTMRKLN
jgi:hypothetical protein